MILVSVDTLRADHLPAYGYRDVDTPALDALPEGLGRVRQRLLSGSPDAAGAHVSLHRPASVPARGAGQHRLPALARDDHARELPQAARLFDRGRRLRFRPRPRDRSRGGVRRLPRRRRDARLGERPWAGSSGAERSRRSCSRRGSGEQPPEKPLFAFLHLYEPHSPYDPPEPFKSRYAKRPYDGEIAAADAVVGRFLGFLKSERIYDKAIVVFLSDHGEGLGDHGEDEHGIFLYREELRVPLFVKLPGSARAGERIGAPAGLVDVFPTVAALLGEKVPPALAGEPLLAGGSRPRARAASLFRDALSAPSLRLERPRLADGRDGTSTSRPRGRSSTTGRRTLPRRATSPAGCRRPSAR